MPLLEIDTQRCLIYICDQSSRIMVYKWNHKKRQITVVRRLEVGEVQSFVLNMSNHLCVALHRQDTDNVWRILRTFDPDTSWSLVKNQKDYVIKTDMYPYNQVDKHDNLYTLEGIWCPNPSIFIIMMASCM